MADLDIAIKMLGQDQASSPISNVTRSLQSLESAAGTAGRPVTSLFTALVQGAAFAVTTRAIDAITAALSAVGSATIGLNSKLEQSNIAFTTMLGSGQKAQAFLDQLAKFAATTPFEFPELVDAAKKMLAFGFTSEQVIPILTAVGNTAAAMGSGQEGINRITLALGQMQAKSKVAGDEMLQLTEAGVPAWQILAKTLGTDVAGAMKQVEARAVDSSVFLKAFQEDVKVRFGDMMAAQSHTFEGAMSTVKDTLGMAIANSFKPFFELLSQGADQLATWLQTKDFEQWQTKVAALVLQARNDIVAWGTGVLTFIQQHSTQISNILQTVWSTITTFIGDRILITRALVLAGWEAIQGNTDRAGQLLQQTVNFVWQNIQTFTGQVWGTITALLTQAWDGLLALVDQRWPGMADTIRSAWDTVQQTTTTVWNAIHDFLDNTSLVIRALLLAGWNAMHGDTDRAGQLLQQTVGFVWEGIQTVIGNVTKTVGDLVTQAWDALVDLADTNFPEISGAVRIAFSSIQGFWEDTLRPTLQNILTMFGSVKDWAVAHWPDIQAAIGTAWTAIQGFWRDTLQPALQGVLDFFGNIKDWVIEHWPEIQTAISVAWTAIRGFWTDTLQPALQGVLTKFGEILAWAQENWPQVQTAVWNTWNAIKGFWDETLQPTLKGVLDKFGEILTWAQDHWPDVQTAVETAWKGIQTLWDTVLWPVLRDLNVKWDELLSWATAHWPDVQHTVENAWQGIQTAWDTVLWPVLRDLNVKWDELLSWAKQHWPAVQTTIENAWTGIKTAWETVLWPALRDLNVKWDELRTWALNNWPTVEKTVTTAFKNMADGANDPKSGLNQAVTALWAQLLGLNTELAKQGAYTNLQTAWKLLSENIGPPLKTILENVADQVHKVYDWFTQAGGGEGGGQNIGVRLFAAGITTLTNVLKTFFAGIAIGLANMQAFGDVLGIIGNALPDIGKAIQLGLTGHFQEAMDAARGAMGVLQQIGTRGQSLFTQIGGILNTAFGEGQVPGGPLPLPTTPPALPTLPGGPTNPFQPPPPPPIVAPPTNPAPPFTPQPPGQVQLPPGLGTGGPIFQAASQVAAATGLPAGIMVGIAVNEGVMVPGTLAHDQYNVGGIKTAGLPGPSIRLPTTEYDANGRPYNTYDDFRVFSSIADGFQGFAQFLDRNPRYGQALAVRGNPTMFINALAAAGYATDPGWPGQVLGIAANAPQYGFGGLVSSPTLAMVGERGPERILSPEQTAAYDQGGRPERHYHVHINGTLLSADDIRREVDGAFRRLEYMGR